MPNSIAYIVLFGWPLVVFVLFRWLPRAQALVWSIVGGYLVLPFGVGINLPVLPTFDKSLIPTLSALVMCLLGIAPFALAPRRPARSACGGTVRHEAALTRQETRRPGRARRPGRVTRTAAAVSAGHRSTCGCCCSWRRS